MNSRKKIFIFLPAVFTFNPFSLKSCIQHYKKRKYVRYFIAKFLISWYTLCMKENLIHYRTCVCNINYHMVWSVKYRRKILNAEVEAYLQEAFRTFSGNKKPALERGAVEPFLLCGNSRSCIGRKYPQVYRTSEQSLLI